MGVCKGKAIYFLYGRNCSVIVEQVFTFKYLILHCIGMHYFDLCFAPLEF